MIRDLINGLVLILQAEETDAEQARMQDLKQLLQESEQMECIGRYTIPIKERSLSTVIWAGMRINAH